LFYTKPPWRGGAAASLHQLRDLGRAVAPPVLGAAVAFGVFLNLAECVWKQQLHIIIS